MLESGIIVSCISAMVLLLTPIIGSSMKSSCTDVDMKEHPDYYLIKRLNDIHSKEYHKKNNIIEEYIGINENDGLRLKKYDK